MITAELRIQTLPGKRQEAIDILISLQESLKLKHDCVACKIYETYGEENSILYREHWRTKDALSRHIRSDLFRRILTVMELGEVSPQITFEEQGKMQGMELIVALREGTH